MSSEKSFIGLRGESAVADFLTTSGHRILARNWRSGHLELDLVSRDRSGLHFVEVKTRSSSELAAPQESVGYRKQRSVVAAAKQFLGRSQGRFRGQEVFFDVAAVIDKGNSMEISYFPNAFIPML
mgnify:CR=1 FL=1